MRQPSKADLSPLLAHHDAFFKPFVLLFLYSCTDMPTDVRRAFYGELCGKITTSYGGARVVNEALGTALPTGRATAGEVEPIIYAFWASFLLFAPWGEAIMALAPGNEPAWAREPVVRAMRFYFKLCEIRKCSCSWRQRWLSAWTGAAGLEARYQFCEGLQFPIEWPLWSRDLGRTRWEQYMAGELAIERPMKQACAATRSAGRPPPVEGYTGTSPPCPVCGAMPDAVYVKSRALARFICNLCGYAFTWDLAISWKAGR